ncbi:hypothetical protein C6503_04490 [Candidatus Poribacteria bacterium]|nr:MAG: hypothetical protein C6503_04490 [Candidatus Poribacteria bacterium]
MYTKIKTKHEHPIIPICGVLEETPQQKPQMRSAFRQTKCYTFYQIIFFALKKLTPKTPQKPDTTWVHTDKQKTCNVTLV